MHMDKAVGRRQAGKYSNSGTHTCTDCPLVNILQVAYHHVSCPQGEYQDKIGQTSCNAYIGKYNDIVDLQPVQIVLQANIKVRK